MSNNEVRRQKKTLTNVRFSYASVFEPKKFNDKDEPKYQVTLLIPKNTKEGKKLIKELENAIEELKANNKDDLFKGSFGAKFWNPLRDGDEEKPDVEGYEDCMFIAAKNDRKPNVYDSKLQEIVEPSEFYSGCYGHASIVLSAYNVAGSKGIGVYLKGVVKIKDGEPFGEGGNSKEDFADIMGVEIDTDDDEDDDEGFK